MVEFGDVTAAMRMRDTIARIVRETVDAFRPPDRYGRVVDLNRFSGQASVLLNGDTDPIAVRMGSGIQPMFTETNAGAGNGSMVRVGGTPGNYWIQQVISGQAQSVKEGLTHPRLMGGVFFQDQTASYDTVGPVALQAIGNTTHFGRWDNTNSFGGAGTAFLEIVLKWTFFTGNVKYYFVPLRSNGTNGAWVKLAPVSDSGDNSGNDFELEIMADGTGYELRARRMNYFGGGLTPGGMSVAVWTHGDAFDYVAGSALGEQSSAVPNVFFGTDAPNYQKGPFLSPGQWIPAGAQLSLTGGSTIIWDGTNVTWSNSFRISTLGRNQYFPGGFIDISQPANGTVLSVFGTSGSTTRTVSASGITLTDGESLYCEPPFGDTTTTAAAATSIKIVARTATDRYFQVPTHWVLLAYIENGKFYSASRDQSIPLVRLIQATTQSIANNADVALTFGTGSTDIDTHSFHSETTNTTRITPKVAGYYRFDTQLYMPGRADYSFLGAAIAKNGVSVATRDRNGPNANASSRSADTSAILAMNGTTDYAEAWANQANTAAVAVSTNINASFTSSFSAEFLRPL